MPIYDFKCQKCGKISEFLALNSSNGGTWVCPICGSQNMEKIISAPHFLKDSVNAQGHTCCGREERCSTPSCSAGGRCHGH